MNRANEDEIIRRLAKEEDDKASEIADQMERGAAALDYQWDRNLRSATKAFLVGYTVRFFTLYAAATTPAEAIAFFDAIKHGVEALGVGRPNQKEN